MNKIFVVGFKPFEKIKTNPSRVIAEWLDGSEGPFGPGRPNLAARINSFILPVKRLAPEIDNFIFDIQKELPLAVVIFGAAAGRGTINIEQNFINRFDQRNGMINDGISGSINPGRPGSHSYKSAGDCEKIARALRRKGIPASVSQNAGTYLCNYLAYRVMDAVVCNGYFGKVFLVHLPLLTGEVCRNKEFYNFPSMAHEKILEAGEVILENIF